ncbi:hypothetical protein FQR65_LT14382 [Abscondita terminalis]|nr:hypothetical protein FQR65_LT14382 [Abscondita terminalis]
MIKIAIVSVLVLFIKAQSDQEEFRGGAILGPYHHIVIQIFDDDDTLVPPILNVNEGANLTLNCRTFHLLYHPGKNYYDEDIIWSRAQNWRRRMHQKSIQNIQKNAKLTFETVTLEDQGRYICTSLKYHTSRILYIIVQSKNRTEQYFRGKRNLIQTTTETSKKGGNETVLFDSENVLSIMLQKGSFQRGVHVIFIMTALAVITLTLILMVVVRMCKKCTGLRKRNLANIYIIPVADLPCGRLHQDY